MSTYFQDTITAIATPPGKGGIGIIRVSGRDLKSFALTLTNKLNITPRQAYFCSFYAIDQAVIDTGVLLFFEAPYSFTGEDVIELQAHGSPVGLQRLLTRCIELGARLALPGEFSKRAFLNDKIDLIQAESIADFIEAESESASRMASRSLQGIFSQRIHALQKQLTTLRIIVEGSLDFPEEDIDFMAELSVNKQLLELHSQVMELLPNAEQGSRLREGCSLVLIGAPNVGKSSLLNHLAEDEVAIVTPIAGTTRDNLREKILLNGLSFHVTDTAGLRLTEDWIESLGIKKTYKAVQSADLALIIMEPQSDLNASTKTLLDQLPKHCKRIYILNKIDLISGKPEITQHPSGEPLVKISVKEDWGLDLLKQTILNQVSYPGENDSLFLARKRHVTALKRVEDELEEAIQQYTFIDLLAEHLKRAQLALDEITGQHTSDELLGAIFSQFCIGK
ncbi:MAG: tRNA uridine-5-carboxymethylaminomethyl(34) synthesis GTPase MnmE [Neisseriaceae bacterium]